MIQPIAHPEIPAGVPALKCHPVPDLMLIKKTVPVSGTAFRTPLL